MRKTALLIYIFSAFCIQAQQSRKISGRIIDQDTKSVLIGANVLILGQQRGASTDADGYFEISNLELGTYILKISYIGYQNKNIPDVIVNSSKPAFLNIELSQSPIETEDIVISSGYFQNDITSLPSTIGLSKEEIRRYPGGFEDVVRTVSTLPGVSINSSGGRNDLLVRGGGPSENLYVINNIEVPNINHFGTQGTGSGSLSFINLDFVENVNFSTGGFGARFGDKMSSVLELNMARGRRDRLGFKGLVSATQFGLNIEGPLFSNGDFIFSARKSYLDLIFKAAGLPFIPVYTDFNFISNFDFSQKDRLSIIAFAAIDNIDRNNDTEENRIKNESLLDNTQEQYIIGANYRRIHLNGYADITLNANFYKYRFSQADRQGNEYFKSSADEAEFSLKAQRFWKLSKNANLLFGFSGKINNNNNNTIFADSVFSSSGQKIPVENLGFSNVDKIDLSTNKYSLFVQSEINLSEKILLTTGLRGEYYNSINEKFYLSPRLNAEYILSSNQSVKLSYGEYYQSPSAVWLVNDYNKNLRALKNSMIIVGWDYLIKPDLKFKIEAYHKSYSDIPTGIVPGLTDYIVMSNTGSNYGGREDDFISFGYFDLESNGSGKSYGLELTLQKKYSDTPLYGQMSLTFGKSEVTAGNGLTYPGEFDQSFIFNISAGYKFSNNWEVSGKFRYFTGVPYTPLYTPDKNPVNPGLVKNLPGEYLSARLDDGHHLDLRVDRYFNFENWTLIVYLDIQNIYNYKVPVKPQYDFWENEIDFTNNIGLLPSIGISAEF